MPFKTARRIPVREHPLESPVCCEMMHKRPLRAARRSVTAPLCCRLMEGANLFPSIAPLLEPVVRLVGWRGSNYCPGTSWCRSTVTRAEFGMCAGHGVRSPTSSKVQGGSKSRSWRGHSSASQPSRCRASPRRSWAKGRCRGSGHRHFSKVQRLGGARIETFEPFKHKNNSHLGARCKQTTRT